MSQAQDKPAGTIKKATMYNSNVGMFIIRMSNFLEQTFIVCQ